MLLLPPLAQEESFTERNRGVRILYRSEVQAPQSEVQIGGLGKCFNISTQANEGPVKFRRASANSTTGWWDSTYSLPNAYYPSKLVDFLFKVSYNMYVG